MSDPFSLVPPAPQREPESDDVRDLVFKNRGALLAVPAIMLVAAGKPSAFSVAVGLPVAFAGEAIRCWAVGYSGVTTRSDRVTAPRLVTAGPYAHVRNPLYVGNALTALGFSIAFTGKNSISSRLGLSLLGLGAMAAVYATIVPLEESYLRATFGEQFEEYMRRVPRVIPQVDAAAPAQGTYDPSVIGTAESRTFVSFGLMLAALAIKAARA